MRRAAEKAGIALNSLLVETWAWKEVGCVSGSGGKGSLLHRGRVSVPLQSHEHGPQPRTRKQRLEGAAWLRAAYGKRRETKRSKIR